MHASLIDVDTEKPYGRSAVEREPMLRRGNDTQRQTDLGDISVRQLRNPRPRDINMSPAVRP